MKSHKRPFLSSLHPRQDVKQFSVVSSTFIDWIETSVDEDFAEISNEDMRSSELFLYFKKSFSWDFYKKSFMLWWAVILPDWTVFLNRRGNSSSKFISVFDTFRKPGLPEFLWKPEAESMWWIFLTSTPLMSEFSSISITNSVIDELLATFEGFFDISSLTSNDFLAALSKINNFFKY